MGEGWDVNPVFKKIFNHYFKFNLQRKLSSSYPKNLGKVKIHV